MPLDNKYADVPLRIRSWGVIICVFAAAVSHPYAMELSQLLHLYGRSLYGYGDRPYPISMP